MASTPFKVVSWSPLDPITDEKLDAMVNNDNYLLDNMVTGKYGGLSVSRTTGLKIMSGMVLFTTSKAASAARNVSFQNFFSASCSPIVTTATVNKAQRKVFVTIDGPGTKPTPTRDGFQVHVFVDSGITGKKKNKITTNFYVSWIALGY